MSLSLSGDQVVEIMKTLPGILAAVASLIIAIKAQRSARSAQRSAEAAHEKAADAAREQLTFALKRAVRDAKAQGVPVVVPAAALLRSTATPLEEGGAS